MSTILKKKEFSNNYLFCRCEVLFAIIIQAMFLHIRSCCTDANGDANSLFVMIDQEPVYLFFYAVHLIKNVRNNLLANKKLIFPPFSFNGFQEKLDVPGGEISWKLLHDVHDNDKSLSANLKKAPKLNSKVCFLITNTRQLHISY